jgi:hypothetical protein
MSSSQRESHRSDGYRRFLPRGWWSASAPPAGGDAARRGTRVPAGTSIGVARLDIAALLANAPVEPHAYLGAERAARFAATPTPLRPVMVFETERGLLLADGYHRVAAARLRGERTIEAEVRLGSWDDALRYVASRRGNTSDEVPAQITPGTDGA